MSMNRKEHIPCTHWILMIKHLKFLPLNSVLVFKLIDTFELRFTNVSEDIG